MITENDITSAITYSRSIMAETLHIAGYTIEIEQDCDCTNPYDDEGMSPAIWLNHGLTEYGDSYIESFFDRVSPAWVSRQWRKIAEILELDPVAHDNDARCDSKHYGAPLSDMRHEMFTEALSDMRAESWGYGVNYLEALAALYALAGIPAETFQRNGYSQGDSVYGLIVMPPEWAKRVGAPHAMPGKIDTEQCSKDMSSQADTYGAWVWGDCYGYIITDAQGDDVDSCWGFIGSDTTDSALIDAIAGEINHDMRAKRQARNTRLKDLIRNRVPLDIRASEIAAI